MAQKQKGPGIQSAAGLIRYFDAEEDTAVKIPPSVILIISGLIGLAAILMRVFWVLPAAAAP